MIVFCNLATISTSEKHSENEVMGAFSTLIQIVDTDPKQSELMAHLNAPKAGNVEETEGKDL